MSPPVRLWRWCVNLLRVVLPEGTPGASVLADVDEEFREVLDRRGVFAARLWHLKATGELVAHFGWDAFVESVRSIREGWMMGAWQQDVRVAARQFRKSCKTSSMSSVATLNKPGAFR